MHSPQHLHSIRVWDLPTRIFHWALALSVVCLVVSAWLGGNAMVWHFRFGYTALSLLLFRIVWGVIGGHWSRFAAFIYTPQSTINDMLGRGQSEHSVGHSPLGAVSVFAVLGILLAQVSTGLLSDDEIAASGPLTQFVSSATVNLATNYHKNIGKWLLLALVVLHVAAIAFYTWRRQKLISAMVHGNKQLTTAAPSSRDDALSRAIAALVFALCTGFTTWLAGLAT